MKILQQLARCFMIRNWLLNCGMTFALFSPITVADENSNKEITKKLEYSQGNQGSQVIFILETLNCELKSQIGARSYSLPINIDLGPAIITSAPFFRIETSAAIPANWNGVIEYYLIRPTAPSTPSKDVQPSDTKVAANSMNKNCELKLNYKKPSES